MAAIDARALLEMSSEELDDLFRSSEPGAIPRGEGYGNVLVAPGTDLGDAAAKVIHATSWKG